VVAEVRKFVPRVSRSPRLAGREARADQVGLKRVARRDYSCAAPIERVGAEAAVALGGEEGGDAGAMRGGERRDNVDPLQERTISGRPS
jgi:hypothetical protein